MHPAADEGQVAGAKRTAPAYQLHHYALAVAAIRRQILSCNAQSGTVRLQPSNKRRAARAAFVATMTYAQLSHLVGTEDAYGNAMAECSFAVLERGLIDR